jgi:glycosyltransferase involved in cell wall biosynthesis
MHSVSVVVPLYNCRDYLIECIASLRNQSLTEFTCVVVDDCSSDDSYDLARSLTVEDPRFTVVRNESNLGHIGNYRRGIDLIIGELIIKVDPDDIIESSCLELLSQSFSHDRVVLAYCNGFILENGTRKAYSELGNARVLDGEEFIRKFAEHGNPCIHSGAMFRRAAYDRVGGYVDPFRCKSTWEDSSLWLRLAMHGDVAYVSERLVQYRIREGSATSESRDPARRQSLVFGVLECLQYTEEALRTNIVSERWRPFLKRCYARKLLFCAEMNYMNNAMIALSLRGAWSCAWPEVLLSARTWKLAMRRIVPERVLRRLRASV